MLSHLYVNMPGSDLTELKPADHDWEDKGVFRVFDQNEFHDLNIFRESNFAENGYVFYPNTCFKDDAKCKIHMFFHGCGD